MRVEQRVRAVRALPVVKQRRRDDDPVKPASQRQGHDRQSAADGVVPADREIRHGADVRLDGDERQSELRRGVARAREPPRAHVRVGHAVEGRREDQMLDRLELGVAAARRGEERVDPAGEQRADGAPAGRLVKCGRDAHVAGGERRIPQHVRRLDVAQPPQQPRRDRAVDVQLLVAAHRRHDAGRQKRRRVLGGDRELRRYLDR